MTQRPGAGESRATAPSRPEPTAAAPAKPAQSGPRLSLGGVPTVTGAECATLDAAAVKAGLSLDGMVNRAGFLTAKILMEGLIEELCRKPAKEAMVSVLAGTGRKGTAALAAAKNLAEAGLEVNVVLAGKSKDYEGAAKAHLAALEKSARKVFIGYNERGFDTADLLIDGLIGAGLQGPPRASLSLLIKGANFTLKPTVALDIPSGFDATTGIQSSVTIKAAATFAIGLPKRGLVGTSNQAVCGRVYLLDIGIPGKVWKDALDVDVGDLFGGNEFRIVPSA